MVKVIWRKARNVRLAINMLTCALLLTPFGSLPRETISGFFGRNGANGRPFAKRVARFIDSLHPREAEHCLETAELEAGARAILYPE